MAKARRKRNPLFGAPAELEVFEEERIAGYTIEEVRSCKAPSWRVSWENEDGNAQEKVFRTKGKALVFVGKEVKRKPGGRTRRGSRRPAENPSRARGLDRLTRV